MISPKNVDFYLVVWNKIEAPMRLELFIKAPAGTKTSNNADYLTNTRDSDISDDIQTLIDDNSIDEMNLTDAYIDDIVKPLLGLEVI